MGLSQQIGASSLSKPGVCTSTTRPATPFEGQMIYETDTDKVLVYNGTAFKQVPTAATAGAVLQVVSSGSNSTNFSNSTSAYADTFGVTITPQYNTSKIFIIANISGVFWDTSANGIGLKIYRGSGTPTTGTALQIFESINVTTANLQTSVGFNFLDSPATTSATTYTLALRAMSNAARAQINRDTPYSTSVITLQEISA